jgi:hypothetical protein
MPLCAADNDKQRTPVSDSDTLHEATAATSTYMTARQSMTNVANAPCACDTLSHRLLSAAASHMHHRYFQHDVHVRECVLCMCVHT